MSFISFADPTAAHPGRDRARRPRGVASPSARRTCDRHRMDDDFDRGRAQRPQRQPPIGVSVQLNRKDPQSEQFPHDSQSDDGLSSGYFQQKV